MKVLVFVRKFNDATHTFIYNELQGLQSKDLQIKVVCTQRMFPERYPFPDVEVVPLSVPQRFLANRLHQLGWRLNYRNTPLRKALNTIIEDFQPDIIHCHFGPDGLYFLDNYQGEGRPVFIHFHGFDASIMLKDKLYCQRLDEVFQRADVFPIFVSNFMFRNVVKHKIRVPNHFVLYYGTNTEFFTYSEEPVSREKLVFLQISSLREKKGHPSTLRALAQWSAQHPAQQWEFVMTGAGPEEETLRELAASLGIADHLRFVGFVNSEEAKALLAEAHLFLHHSVTGSKDGDMEGIPNAVMEAMAMGLPVLSTWHSGIPELVEDGVNGFLVGEHDIAKYAQRLTEMMHWQRQPKNREKVRSLFEQKQHATILHGYYLEALKQLTS